MAKLPKRSPGPALFIGLALVGATVIGVGVAMAADNESSGGGGKTGPVPEATPQDALRMAGIVCACVDAGILGTDELAACAAAALWSELEYSWPPPPAAHDTHTAAWVLMRALIGTWKTEATAKGMGLCELLQSKQQEQGPTKILPNSTATLQLPKWNPQSVPGFVAGETFCGDNPTKPYNKNEWTDSGIEIYAAVRELSGKNVPPLNENLSVKDQLVAIAPAVEALQRRLQSRGYSVAVGDPYLVPDGVIGACTLRAASYAKLRWSQGKWAP